MIDPHPTLISNETWFDGDDVGAFAVAWETIDCEWIRVDLNPLDIIEDYNSNNKMIGETNLIGYYLSFRAEECLGIG